MACALPLLAVVVGGLGWEVKPGHMTRDIATLVDVHPLTGFLSSLGILLWCASASIWLFAAGISRGTAGWAQGHFALHSGLLSAYLCLDDLFMVHELLAPRHFGIPEMGVLGGLAAAVLLYLWGHRQMLADWRTVWLAGALAALGSSALLDTLLEPWMWRLGDWAYLLEDGLKWIGTCLWCTFCVVRCSHIVAQARVRFGPVRGPAR